MKMKELEITHNNKVTLISKVVLAGIIASSIGLASVHADTVNADTTQTSTTSIQAAPTGNIPSDYDYSYVGIPSWQEIDEEGAVAQQYNDALAAENANLAEVEAGEAPTHYSPITLSEPTTPTPETTNGNTLQPGDEMEVIDGVSYIITASGQKYKQASSLPTWGYFDYYKDEIQADQAAIANDKAEEAAYEQGSTAPTNVSYSGANQQANYSPTSQATAPSSSASPTSAASSTSPVANGASNTFGTAATSPKQSSALPDSSSSASPMTRFPQTGNKTNYGLTIIGVILAAVASGLTYVKVTGKKLFNNIFGNLHNLFTFSK